MKQQGKTAAIFERQWIHFVLLGLMLIGAWFGARSCPCTQRGDLWGVSSWTWFWIAIEIPIIHQVFVWFCWRTELHTGLLTRVFGRRAFNIFAAIFAVLFLGRFGSVVVLAIASRDSLLFPELPLKILAVLCLIPSTYLGYSVVRYFGFRRAFGEDHFDDSYTSRPLVRQGIFRFAGNAMYIFGFLALYVPGLWFASRPAIFAAAFAHVYIWVHYFTVEKPDMRRIYGPA